MHSAAPASNYRRSRAFRFRSRTTSTNRRCHACRFNCAGRRAAAARDSIVVQRLKAAGAVFVGRTNMTEFAYSGLGINPHYGTPRNVFERAASRIPGGSTSGGAISVTDGMAAGAVGTDTGGSVRIPAALNGLVGFKPTAQRVPLEACCRCRDTRFRRTHRAFGGGLRTARPGARG